MNDNRTAPSNYADAEKVSVMPGGTHIALLSSGHQLQISRLQSRIIRERLLRL